ncbi:2-hydroxy-7-methoxy-5-methyl-1-naphthoate--CoA ligase-like isoform X2 [Babylonia areolata]
MSVPGRTVEELLHHWGLVDPDTEAFVSLQPQTFRRRALTRRELNVLVRRFAAWLRQEGVAKGEAVCVALPNCLERVVADLGVICSGAVALNGQVFRADGQDLVQALNSTKAKAVVVDPDSSRGAWAILKDYVGRLDTDADADVHCERLPYLRRVILCQRSDDPEVDFFSRLLSYSKSLQRAHALPSEEAVIWTTSGSTGYSKLVPQTHANLLHIMRQVLTIARLKSGDLFLNCAPLGWAGGFPLWFLASGATRVFVDTSGGPPQDMASTLWQCLQRERCVYAFVSPMYVSAVLEQPALWQGKEGGKEEGGGKWRPEGICLAGQPMKRALVSAAKRLCEYIDINYGTTECGVIATTRVTQRMEDYEDGMTGPPAEGVQVRIVDENLQDVEDGQTGEILARSPALYGRYVDNPAATERTFTPEGWFRTDDVGYFHSDRGIVHLGRRSDAITRGAYLCYPGWLETLLRRAPNVRDVCVVPVPDPVLHHEICACVVPADQSQVSREELEASLRTFADSVLLTQPGEAQHMAPKYYVQLNSIPLTPTGKISRKDARELAVKELGLCIE